MKKLIITGLLSFLFISACGSDEMKTTSDSSNGGVPSTDNIEEKKDLMRLYMAVPNTINKVDGGLNTFEEQQENGMLPEGEELSALKETAISSAEEASQAVTEIEIPESLSEKDEELQSALTLISGSYGMKAAALSEAEVSFEAANEKFAEADKIFNDILIEYEMIPSSIQNEVK